MKPSDLYKCKPIRVETNLYHLNRHIDTVDFDRIVSCPLQLSFHFYASHGFDLERCWTLFSVFCDNKPFMICQQAGRGGMDYCNEYITDKKLYKYVVDELRKSYEIDNFESTDPEQDIKCLTDFYGHCLDSFYNPNLIPKHKVGDVVLAMVYKNHLSYTSEEKTIARVQIISVNEMNPLHTYFGLQLDRRWCKNEIIEDEDKGEIYASFNDGDVVG